MNPLIITEEDWANSQITTTRHGISNMEQQTQHPNYYNRYSVEVVEMARRIWGDEAMKVAGEITAFIYRMRAGVKPDNPAEVDFAKENFWLDYVKQLNEKQ